MDATLTPHATRAQTPFERLRAISARSGLDLDLVRPAILDRMRLLAELTETVRDCEHAAELAEEIFRYYDARKPGKRFTALERHTVVIGSLFSDIGKSGPADASTDGQRLVAEMFAVEHVPDGTVSASAFFDTYFPADASSRVQRFRALGLDPAMHMRAFWDLHSVWTLQILRGDGVPPQAVAAAATHHLLENVNPHAMFVTDARLTRYIGDSASFGRPEKLVILLDKYDAARRRGQRAHAETIVWLRQVIEAHPRFCQDQEFFSLIDDLDAVIEAAWRPPRPRPVSSPRELVDPFGGKA
jgi:hypothetical protein